MTTKKVLGVVPVEAETTEVGGKTAGTGMVPAGGMSVLLVIVGATTIGSKRETTRMKQHGKASRLAEVPTGRRNPPLMIMRSRP
jgi:hypothetical protein